MSVMRAKMLLCTALGLLPFGLVAPAAGPAAKAPSLEPYRPTAEEIREGYQRGAGRGAARRGRVYKDRITPHWVATDTRFWYRNDLPGETKEFILVDAERGTRGPAFDHKRLAAALSKASGTEYRADRLPFDRIEFAEDAKVLRFRAGG